MNKENEVDRGCIHEAEKLVSIEDIREIANNYSNIATIYVKNFNYKDALYHYRNALDIQEEVLGTSHIANTTIYENIGLAYFNQHKYKNALVYFIKTLKIYKELCIHETSPSPLNIYLHIGRAYEKLMDENKKIKL